MNKNENEQLSFETEIQDLTEKISLIIDTYKKVSDPLITTTEKVPEATEQLDKISKQTEDATQLMLDTIEKVTQRQEEIIADLQNIARLTSDNAELCALTASATEKVTANTNDTYSIMDALQFQDITSQQLNHSIALLDELRENLYRMLSLLHGENLPKSIKEYTPISKNKAYDPHADYSAKRAEQSDVDSIFAATVQSHKE